MTQILAWCYAITMQYFILFVLALKRKSDEGGSINRHLHMCKAIEHGYE